MSKSKKCILLFAVALLLVTPMLAQKFSPPSNRFSGSKPSYITLKDGTTLEGTVKDLDRKKGLIEEVKLELPDGKKRKLKPADIKYMYLPPSGFDKLVGAFEFLHDATKWDNTDLDKDIIGRGYVYFEQAEVRLSKKKTMTMLMQLLNPSFSSKIKVYHDPFAKETMSLGVAGVDVVGGDLKSYFVLANDDKVAFKLEKKDYDDKYKDLFKNCQQLVTELDAKHAWTDLAEYIFKYSKECN